MSQSCIRFCFRLQLLDRNLCTCVLYVCNCLYFLFQLSSLLAVVVFVVLFAVVFFTVTSVSFSLRLLSSLSSLRGRSPFFCTGATAVSFFSAYCQCGFLFRNRCYRRLFSPRLPQLFPLLCYFRYRCLFLCDCCHCRFFLRYFSYGCLFFPQQTEPFSLSLKQISFPLSWLMFFFLRNHISHPSFSAFSTTSSGSWFCAHSYAALLFTRSNASCPVHFPSRSGDTAQSLLVILRYPHILCLIFKFPQVVRPSNYHINGLFQSLIHRQAHPIPVSVTLCQNF